MTDAIAGPGLAGPDVAGQQRVCKRPGCGNVVPVPGRGRTRPFCGDVCSRRFHNAARPGGGVAVSAEQAGDPLGALEALIAQAGSLIKMAREQAAALDPETVAVQLAEAEAARCRAEARAVTAGARAAEAEQEMLAALEEAAAAHRDREAAESGARRACQVAEQARRELAEAVARAHADAEAARVRAGSRPPKPPGSLRRRGQNATWPVRKLRRWSRLPTLNFPAPGRPEPMPVIRPGKPVMTQPVSGRPWLSSTGPGCRQRSSWLPPNASTATACSPPSPQLASIRTRLPRRMLPRRRAGVPVLALPWPGKRHDRRNQRPRAGCGRKRRRTGRDGQPEHCRVRGTAPVPERGIPLPGGTRARRFTSSLVTVMIRKEGTYVRAMRVAAACQLMLDIPGAAGGAGRDPGRVWDQMPGTARARVLRLLAAMIAAGVVIADGECGAGAVRNDG